MNDLTFKDARGEAKSEINFREEWRDAWCDRVDGLDAKYVTNALSTSARECGWRARVHLQGFGLQIMQY